MLGRDTVYTGLYGAGEAEVALENGARFKLVQSTDYPWDGRICFTCQEVKQNVPFTLQLRIPGWAESGFVRVNGQATPITAEQAGSYYAVTMEPEGARVELQLDMSVRATVAHPMVEEAAGQIAVERGPLLYCMESPDAPVDSIDEVLLFANGQYRLVPYTIRERTVLSLEGEGAVLRQAPEPRNGLYRTLHTQCIDTVPIRLIPYFAWDNRGYGEMRVWMPVIHSPLVRDAEERER